jgi:thymidylate synthase (FAD)
MNLQWKKYYPLSDKNAFICLVDHMGDDSSIVQAARVSYGKDEQEKIEYPEHFGLPNPPEVDQKNQQILKDREEQQSKDRNLIRYLLRHSHTTPFEMVEFKFMVQVPMDCWRQWIRHRTANVNEYSTRYSEALNFFQVTDPSEWRLQATDNKQGSSGYLPANQFAKDTLITGRTLTQDEQDFHLEAKVLYQNRLAAGVAKEQARKDLPLSTYTRAYWKCDLHNIFNFLRLRMDYHAQLEIRSYANAMYAIVSQICPVACEAFEDYVLHAKKFSRMELTTLKNALIYEDLERHNSMTDREWKEFLAKLQ